MCNLNNTNMEQDHYVAHSVLAFILALVGTVGNASSIYLICRGRLCNNLNMALLTNLCIADSIITTILLPLIGVNGFHTSWLYGDTFCGIFGYLLFVTVSSEFLILMLITINQYLVVVKNVASSKLWHSGQRGKIVLTFLSPWLFNITLLLFPLTGVWSRFDFDSRLHMCTLINTRGILGMKSFISGGMLLASITVIIYCYTAIFWVQHRSQRRTVPTLRPSGTSNQNMPRNSNNSRNTQLIRMISVILINFGATYLPFFLMYIADPCLSSIPMSMVVVIIYISFSHSATNPIIYAFMNKQIQGQWKQVLGRCFSSP